MTTTPPLEERTPAEPRAARAKRHLRIMAEWLFLGALTGVACGIASAAFLHALDWATRFRTLHETIIYALPLAGLAVGALYVELLGANVFPHVVIVSVIAYLVSGHRGIDPAQRLFRKKLGEIVGRPVALRDYRSVVPAAPVDAAKQLAKGNEPT